MSPFPFKPLDMDAATREAVHQWLCDVFGCHPDHLVASDPEQNFRPVVNLEPLMRILDGPWLAAVLRAYAVKAQMVNRRLPTDGNDGDFTGRVKLRKPAPIGAPLKDDAANAETKVIE